MCDNGLVCGTTSTSLVHSSHTTVVEAIGLEPNLSRGKITPNGSINYISSPRFHGRHGQKGAVDNVVQEIPISSIVYVEWWLPAQSTHI